MCPYTCNIDTQAQFQLLTSWMHMLRMSSNVSIAAVLPRQDDLDLKNPNCHTQIKQSLERLGRHAPGQPLTCDATNMSSDIAIYD
jgi:hypothetical protein